MGWISENNLLEDEVVRLKRAFCKGKPFKNLFIENFLVELEARKLFEELKGEKFHEKNSDLFSFKQTKDLKFSKNKTLKDFCKFLESKSFTEFIKNVSGILVKQGAIDVSGTLYENTDYLLAHDDLLDGRKIAYIFYFSDLVKEDGGLFNLLCSCKGKSTKIWKSYIPRFNSLLIFEVSKKSYHEVVELVRDKKRYAIGGWLK